MNAVFRQIRPDFPAAVPAKDSVPEGVIAERNLVYTTLHDTPFGEGNSYLDVFRPQQPGKRPAVITVHGFAIVMHSFWPFHSWVDKTVNFIAPFLDGVFNTKGENVSGLFFTRSEIPS